MGCSVNMRCSELLLHKFKKLALLPFFGGIEESLGISLPSFAERAVIFFSPGASLRLSRLLLMDLVLGPEGIVE